MSVFDPIEDHITEVDNNLYITPDWLERNGFKKTTTDNVPPNTNTYIRHFNKGELSYIEIKDIKGYNFWLVTEVKEYSWRPPDHKAGLISIRGVLKKILDKYE